MKQCGFMKQRSNWFFFLLDALWMTAADRVSLQSTILHGNSPLYPHRKILHLNLTNQWAEVLFIQELSLSETTILTECTHIVKLCLYYSIKMKMLTVEESVIIQKYHPHLPNIWIWWINIWVVQMNFFFLIWMFWCHVDPAPVTSEKKYLQEKTRMT